MSNNIGLSQGIAIGNAFVLKEKEIPVKQTVSDTESEVIKLKQAIADADAKLSSVLNAHQDMSDAQKEIIETHRMLLNDEAYLEKASGVISDNMVDAPYAAYQAVNELAEVFRSMDSEYFRERAADMMDIGWYVIDALRGETIATMDTLEDVIIIAKDLTPADTVKLDLKKVAGFVTEVGGPTSHTAIIARSMDIPAVRCSGITEHVNAEDIIILDGEKGTVMINPTQNDIHRYEKLIQEHLNEKEELKAYVDVLPTTVDGRQVSVTANIVAPNVVNQVEANGGMGIGLYRSEFLYMESSTAPDEEKQFEAYKMVAESMDGKEVVVRTLDVGGDKAIDYLGIEKEDNPFLGFRAIRYCLGNIPLFKIQIRALLRASHYGTVSIMLPMIGTLEELRQAKGIVQECKNELDSKGVPYDKKTKVGIMIEVPSAAIMSDVLAEEVDFFSIGTNDLIGYTMAADRMNNAVAYLYQEYQPSVLRLIQMTIENGHKAGIPVSMCGNSAANPLLIPVYLGMGLDKFSVNPSEILRVKKLIGSLSENKCKILVDNIAKCGNVDQVLKLVKDL